MYIHIQKYHKDKYKTNEDIKKLVKEAYKKNRPTIKKKKINSKIPQECKISDQAKIHKLNKEKRGEILAENIRNRSINKN